VRTSPSTDKAAITAYSRYTCEFKLSVREFLVPFLKNLRMEVRQKTYNHFEINTRLLVFRSESFFQVQRYEEKTCKTIILQFILYGCESWSHS
jgi:hypothetical protein